MPKVFRFEELTWPEISRLPRSVPLVLPIEDEMPEDDIVSHFPDFDLIGVLPSFPLTWRSIYLTSSIELIQNYIKNNLLSLKDQAFDNINILIRNHLFSFDDAFSMGDVLSKITPSKPISDSDLSKVVLIPIGHTEQHAYHLPLSTDTLIIKAISNGVEERIPDLAITLPVMPYGVSTHTQSFPGTFNTGGRVFEDYWISVIDMLVEKGFSRFYLLSGHGGNCSFLVNVVKYVGEKHPTIFCATSYLYLNSPSGILALEKYRSSPLGGMGHACELETSLILKIAPHLVKMDSVIDEVEFISTPSYYMDWIEGGSLIANPPWLDDTLTGAYGAGSLATIEKGTIWLNKAIEEKIGHVHEIHEQFTRRLSQKGNQPRIKT